MPAPYNFDKQINTGDTTPSPAAWASSVSAALDEGTVAPTPNVFALRDAYGRAQFADPATGQDAATKNYADVNYVPSTGLPKYDAPALGLYFPEAHGAVGDGLTDDTVAINAAITAANTAGGGTVAFRAVKYRTTANLSMKSNVALRGAGPGTNIYSDMTAAAHTITSVSGAANVSITSLAISQSTSTFNRCAIAMLSATAVTISDVLVLNCYYDAVQIIACNDVTVSNVIGLSCGRNGVAIDQTVGSSHDVTVSNCVMVANGTSTNLNAGYDIESAQDVALTNLTTRGFVYGLVVVSETTGPYLSQRVIVNGLVVNGQSSFGVYVLGDAGQVSDVMLRGVTVGNGTGAQGVAIVGNVVGWSLDGFDLLGTTTASKNGVVVGAGTSGNPGPGRISNGRISGYTSHGISSVSQVIVSGVSSASAGSGVFLSNSGANGSVITGCILAGNTRYGVESFGTCDQLIIGPNDLRGNTSGDLSLVGTGNILNGYRPKVGLTEPGITAAYLLQMPSTITLATAGAVTIDATKGDVIVTLQANATSSVIANPAVNQKITVTFLQDATGGRTYVWPSNVKFAGGAGPADTTANKRSSVTLWYDGTSWQEQARSVAVG